MRGVIRELRLDRGMHERRVVAEVTVLLVASTDAEEHFLTHLPSGTIFVSRSSGFCEDHSDCKSSPTLARACWKARFLFETEKA